MIRVARLLVVCPMAAVAIARRPLVNIVLVTGTAVECSVDPLKGKAGAMVE